jgi:peptidoglycan hydrolase CwlO-like protein
MRIFTLTALLMLTLSEPAFARNISIEQSEAASARDAVGDAMSKLSDIEQKIQRQQALLTQEQEKLKQYQAEKAQTEKDLEAKKAIFEQKSKLLDEAWKQRTDY